VGKRLGTFRHAEQDPKGAQCFGGFGKAAANQDRRNMRLLLHAVGERDMGRCRVAEASQHFLGCNRIEGNRARRSL
jgi:hypothetical protein